MKLKALQIVVSVLISLDYYRLQLNWHICSGNLLVQQCLLYIVLPDSDCSCSDRVLDAERIYYSSGID